MTRLAHILIASTRAAGGVYQDRTGPLILAWLEERGWTTRLHVVPDGDEVGQALRDALEESPALILTSGGTGAAPGDGTPEATRALLDFEIPGIAEELRRRAAPRVPTAILSRGLAGVSGSTVLINLPGSPGGVSDGLGLLDEILDHLLDQVAGGDHVR